MSVSEHGRDATIIPTARRLLTRSVRCDAVGIAIELREMASSDGPMWLRLYESVAAEGHWIGGEVPVEPGWADRVVVAYTGRDDAAALFAEADGVAVGWINMSLDGDTVALGMGIIESYRSQGIGSAMMEAAVAWAEVVRATRLRLEVFSHNERAIQLYRKFGFTEVESRVGAHERRTGERFDGLVMVRSLRSG